MKATEHSLPWPMVREQLERLSCMIEASDVYGARKLLQHMVVEFTPTSAVVDWVTLVDKPAFSPSSDVALLSKML